MMREPFSSTGSGRMIGVCASWYVLLLKRYEKIPKAVDATAMIVDMREIISSGGM
jgi:hypothetical protein